MESAHFNEAELAGIIDSAMDAIVTLDENHNVVIFNRAAERMFGCSAKEVLGQPHDRLLPPRSRAAHAAHIRRFAESGYTTRPMGQPGLVTAVRHSGEEFPVEATISQTEAPGRKLYTVILRDVSERVSSEHLLAEAHQATRLRNEVLRTVTHDLMNPVATIKMIAQLLRVRLPQLHTEDVERDLGLIESAALRVTRQLHQLVDVARLQAGRALALSLGEVDLAALVRREVEERRRCGGNLELRCAAEAVRGRWDQPRIERVVANLLSNAVKYSPDGTPVSVALQLLEEAGRAFAVLQVRDQGLGIPEADLPHVFEPFFRARNVGRILGTGLGLSSSRQIVEQHGGTLRLSSREGQGTTAELRLPCESVTVS